MAQVDDHPTVETSEPHHGDASDELAQALGEVLSAPEQQNDELETLWAVVLEDWDEPARHELFLQGCVRHENLALAAEKYREQQENEQHTQVAAKKLTAITMLAVQLLESKRTPRETTKTPRWVYVAAVLVCMAALWWLGHAFSAR